MNGHADLSIVGKHRNYLSCLQSCLTLKLLFVIVAIIIKSCRVIGPYKHYANNMLSNNLNYR